MSLPLRGPLRGLCEHREFHAGLYDGEEGGPVGELVQEVTPTEQRPHRQGAV